MFHLNVEESTAMKFKQFTYQMSAKLNRRVTQGEILKMAVEALERELASSKESATLTP